MFTIHENSAGVSFTVRVHPRAKHDVIVGEIGDALKLALKAPPVEGRANEACIEFFAKSFGCTPFFRYHSVRRNRPEQSYAGHGNISGRRT